MKERQCEWIAPQSSLLPGPDSLGVRPDAIYAINFWLTCAMRSFDETGLGAH
jgi:hypothetical protein